MRRWLFRLHRYTGVTSGIFLLLVGLSGSMLVYFDELERAVNPTLYNLEFDEDRFSYDSIYRFVAGKYHQGLVGISMNVPQTDHEVVSFTLVRSGNGNSGNEFFLVSVNPYTLEVLRQGSFSDISTSFMHWMLLFHDSFQLGRIGLLIVACLSLVMFISIVSGVIIYWRNITDVVLFRLVLRNRKSGNALRMMHRYVGVWAIVFNLVVFGTGFWMLRGMFGPDAWTKPPTPQPYQTVHAILDSCITVTKHASDDFRLGLVNFPESDSGQVVVSGHRVTGNPFISSFYFYFNQQNARLEDTYFVADDEFSSKLEASVWGLHIGSYGGHFVKLLYILGGLTPGVLSLTGLAVLRRRTLTKRFGLH